MIGKYGICSLLLLVYILFLNCSKEIFRPTTEYVSIDLRWIPAYENQTIEELEKGLLWSLSFLGATLPKGSFREALRYETPHRFTLSFDNLGFSPQALDALKTIIEKLEDSEEFERFEAIDAARFVVLTLHSSWHYYRITEVPINLQQFLERHPENGKLVFPVVSSSIAEKSRMIKFNLEEQPTRMSFLAEETAEDTIVKDKKYEIKHFETLEVMPNGQLRFGIYDLNGNLIPAAPARETLAGKPSKCLWCHETHVQPLFAPTPDVTGFMSSAEYQSWIDSSNALIDGMRDGLDSDLDFARQPDHTFSELLYISFMEPSLMRIAGEWELPLESVQRALESFPQHNHEEFHFLQALFERSVVDSLAPFRAIPVPGDVREPNEEEPNFF